MQGVFVAQNVGLEWIKDLEKLGEEEKRLKQQQEFLKDVAEGVNNM